MIHQTVLKISEDTQDSDVPNKNAELDELGKLETWTGSNFAVPQTNEGSSEVWFRPCTSMIFVYSCDYGKGMTTFADVCLRFRLGINLPAKGS